jgi:opacity protein-like surface antigen
MKTTTISVAATVLVLTCAAAANAQQPAASPTAQNTTMPLGDKVFLSLNVGAQTRSSTISKDFSFPLYRETATATTGAGIGGGPIFDISGGFRFAPQFGVAVGYSHFGDTGAAQGSASIPNPTFFNRPAAVTISPVDSKRTEHATYVILVGTLPVGEKSDLSLFIGPAFTKVSQDLIYDVSVTPGTQSVLSPVRNEAATAKGINVGGDISYQFMKTVGAGLFVRYIGGTVDLPSISDVKVGGIQFGIGARLRF